MHSTLRFVSWKRAYFRFAVLVCMWLLGILLGCLVFNSSSEVYSSLMRRSICAPVSIVGLLSIFILPVITVILVVINCDPSVFCIACFLKAFLFSVATLSCYGAFRQGGWLAQLVIMFADNCSALILLCMAFAGYYQRKKLLMGRIVIIMVILAVVLTAGYYLFQP